MKPKQNLSLPAALYLPCRNCGQWRRQHVGPERKCVFQASLYEPKEPRDLTSDERYQLIARIERLRKQILRPLEKENMRVEKRLDALTDIAGEGCTHRDEEGISLAERHDDPRYPRIHFACSVCDYDWYEDRKD